jgi:hypothetical protein
LFCFCFVLYWIIISAWSCSRVLTTLVLLVLFLRIFLLFFFNFILQYFDSWGLTIIVFFNSFYDVESLIFFLFFKIQWQLLSFVFLHCRKFIMVRGEARAILHPCPNIGFGYPIYCSHVRINIVITYFWLNYQHIE